MSEANSKQVSYFIEVSGRVQGVGFRYSAQREAKRRGVTGWVRNDRDGTVEVNCEGDEKSVKQFINWLSSGPPGAYVTDVKTKKKPYQGTFRSFTIEY